MAMGARFAKWGLGLFIFGVFLTFGIIAHYCAGARWPTGRCSCKTSRCGWHVRGRCRWLLCRRAASVWWRWDRPACWRHASHLTARRRVPPRSGYASSACSAFLLWAIPATSSSMRSGRVSLFASRRREERMVARPGVLRRGVFRGRAPCVQHGAGALDAVPAKA